MVEHEINEHNISMALQGNGTLLEIVLEVICGEVDAAGTADAKVA